VTDPHRKARAASVVNDEILTEAFSTMMVRENQALLAAKTQEERDEHWRMYHAFKKALEQLRMWATAPDPKQ